jgi:hypothetical protein
MFVVAFTNRSNFRHLNKAIWQGAGLGLSLSGDIIKAMVEI